MENIDSMKTGELVKKLQNYDKYKDKTQNQIKELLKGVDKQRKELKRLEKSGTYNLESVNVPEDVVSLITANLKLSTQRSLNKKTLNKTETAYIDKLRRNLYNKITNIEYYTIRKNNVEIFKNNKEFYKYHRDYIWKLSLDELLFYLDLNKKVYKNGFYYNNQRDYDLDIWAFCFYEDHVIFMG
jgi:hypothetical protein